MARRPADRIRNDILALQEDDVRPGAVIALPFVGLDPLEDELEELRAIAGVDLEDFDEEEVDDLELPDALTGQAQDLLDAELSADDVLDADDIVPVEDGRTTDDFDFATLVAGFSIIDVEGCVAALEAEKAAYVAAYRREARKGNAVADFYNVANTPIFRRRKAIKETIAQIEGMKRLSEARKHELVRARQHLEYITELLVRFNYGMTRSYVRKFTSNTSAEDSADFQGAANVGLMHAIATFDPDLGRFGSWAFKPIQRAVLRAVQQADFSNMTGGDFERRPHILRAQAKLAGPNGEYTPSPEEIAAEAQVTVALVKRVLEAPHLDSLHGKVGSEDTAELGDLIPDDAVPLDEMVHLEMEVATLMTHGLPILEPREKYVLVCRYGLHGEQPEPLSDIGRRLGLSREAVRQIAGKALARLQHPVVLSALVRGGRQ